MTQKHLDALTATSATLKRKSKKLTQPAVDGARETLKQVDLPQPESQSRSQAQHQSQLHVQSQSQYQPQSRGKQGASLAAVDGELHESLTYAQDTPFANTSAEKYTAIDLFAGIGGIRMGFTQTGLVQVVFSSEIDKFARTTYRANFGEERHGDITLIANANIPEHDILLGGFPCQAFSQAGKKLGFEDARGTLFFEIARILQAKRPRAFLLENVKNLTSHNKGQTFATIMEILDQLGYAVFTRLFKAKDFGLPQNRERIYIVGFAKEQVPNWQEFKFPVPPCTPTRVGDILEAQVDDKYTISDTLWQGHQRRKQEHLDKGNGFGYSLFTADDAYTNTISARYYKDGSEILIAQDGKNPRKLTPREAARLQGFPEEFIIPVSDMQSYKQFGNSVAVPVIHAIAKEMLQVLETISLDSK